MKTFEGSNEGLETLQLLLDASANPNPEVFNYGGEPRQAKAGFISTPLQLAVYLLEYNWV